MKYSILGFNQEKIVNLKIPANQKSKLNIEDLMLLDYIQKAVTQYSLKHITDDNGISYVWLRHQKILEDLPILSVGKYMLIKRLQKLIDYQLITATVVSNESGRGSKTYYTVTPLVEELQFNNDERPGVKNANCSSGPGVKNANSDNKLIINNNLEDYYPNNLPNNKLLGDKKKNRYEICVGEIESFTNNKKLREVLTNYLKMRLEQKDKPMYKNQWKGLLNKLENLSNDINKQIEIVEFALERGYASFFLPNENWKVWKKKDVGNSTPYTEEELRTLDEKERKLNRDGIKTRF